MKRRRSLTKSFVSSARRGSLESLKPDRDLGVDRLLAIASMSADLAREILND